MTYSFIIPVLFSLFSLLFGNEQADVVFAGDAMMHQAQIDAARRSDGTYDYSEYFEFITPYVTASDYAVVNLETAVSKPPYSGYPCFNSPASYIDALRDAGFDLFLTANNHTLDRRDAGLRSTIAALDDRGVDHIGTYIDENDRAVRLPFIKNINGIKIGFLDYTYGTNGIVPGKEVIVDYIDRKVIESDVIRTKAAGADVIVVCMHWGDEHRMLPNMGQRSLADFLKGLDVDVIIGGHPHVVQPAELTLRADGRPQLLYYSLGNFISNMRQVNCRGGMLCRVTFTRGDDGKVRVTDSSYRLVFTEPADSEHNFRLRWVDDSSHPGAAAFSKNAREILDKHNIDVTEDR